MGVGIESRKLARFWTKRYLRYFVGIALGLHTIWFLSGLLWPYYWTLFASLLGPLAACLFAGRFADGSVSRTNGRVQEENVSRYPLNGELDAVRFLKAQKNFDKALALVNNVLAQRPDSPEAYYLKAQVLLEGFKNPWAAESYFKRAIQLADSSEPVHKWASCCLSSIYSKVSQ